MKLKVYFASAYRGALGDDASEDDIRINIEKALEVGCKIRSDFPDIQLFIPHEETICNILWKDGLVESEDILHACCQIVKQMDLLVVYGAVYGGMITEILEAEANGITVYYMETYDEQAKYELSQIAYNLLEMSEPSEDRDS